MPGSLGFEEFLKFVADLASRHGYQRCSTSYPGRSRPNGHCPPLIQWPPDTPLYKGAQYVVKNFASLTLYLSEPRLEYTNNRRERGLRAEKSMLLGSKFRGNREGRASMDILRTMEVTCVACGLELGDYFRHLYKHRHVVKEHPEDFTPYAVMLALEQTKAAAKD